RFDVDALYGKGLSIFEAYRAELEKNHWGEYCVIDLNSEKVFTARTEESARKKAREGAPNGFYTTFGIGFDASIRMRTRRHG
ncbi:MAG TPA: hypothetical protein VG537_04575, partial [Candidatus Kapabacteria bacterium]|nr:hypothetical protein [Candidatus Kapabacteria bacterium]